MNLSDVSALESLIGSFAGCVFLHDRNALIYTLFFLYVLLVHFGVDDYVPP